MVTGQKEDVRVSNERLKQMLEDASGINGDGRAIETDDDLPSLLERIKERRFDITKPPTAVIPRYFVNGTPICTPGNLTVIAAGPKAGKSTWLGAMMAAVMTPPDAVADCFGITSSNPEGKALIHLDTEQTPGDHYTLIGRSMKRALIQKQPPWLESFCLTGFDPRDARNAVRLLLEECASKLEESQHKHGGTHSVLIDGFADLAFDVNDPGEAAKLVGDLHALAIKYSCPIVGVLHLNPGSATKTRGHLGSQLERKAETNLKLEIKQGVTTVWAEKNRRAPISKEEGPRFAWSDEMQMHVSTKRKAAAKEDKKRKALTEQAKKIYGDRPSMRRDDIENDLQKIMKASPTTAYRRTKQMIDMAVIKKDTDGSYVQTCFTE
jgi:hypothetical protein